MAHSLSAKKRVRQNLKKRMHNKRIKSITKAQLKKLRTVVSDYKNAKTKDDKESVKTLTAQLKQELQKTYCLLDKASKSRVFHKNKANRLKSRLSLAVNNAL